MKRQARSFEGEGDEASGSTIELFKDAGSNRLATLTSTRHTKPIAARRTTDTIARGIVQSPVNIGRSSTIAERLNSRHGLLGVAKGLKNTGPVRGPTRVPKSAGESGMGEVTENPSAYRIALRPGRGDEDGWVTCFWVMNESMGKWRR